MTTLQINVDDDFYRDLEKRAREQHRTAADVAHDILLGRDKPIQSRTGKTSIFDLQPFSVGEVLNPFSSEDDLLEEMLYDRNF